MDLRVLQSGASATPPSAPASPSLGHPSAGVPGVTPAGVAGPYWHYQIAEELRNLQLAAGVTPNHLTLTQLKTALDALYAPHEVGAKVIINFNGFTGVIAYSKNVASLTKISTGIFEINFSSPMADANYAFSGSCGDTNGVVNAGGNNIVSGTGATGSVKTTSKLRVYCWDSAAAGCEDSTSISVIVWGN